MIHTVKSCKYNSTQLTDFLPHEWFYSPLKLVQNGYIDNGEATVYSGSGNEVSRLTLVVMT